MSDRDLQQLQAEIERLRDRLAELEGRPAAPLQGLLAKVGSNPRLRVALVAAVVLAAAVSYAAQIPVPYSFVNGTPADADEVNANFSALVAESNDQDSRLTTVENDLGAHEGDASAHHAKTIDFSDLTVGEAQDSQVADNITINYATAAGYAVTAADANTLDTLDSTAFALSGHNHDDRYYSEAEVDALLATLSDRIAALEALLGGVSRGETPDTLTFSGMNVQVVDGSGGTDGTVNGLGNLIVGYNENSYSATRTGSHNLVVGYDHEYTSYAGLVAGWQNTISAASCSVSGGTANTASGDYSSVSGGHHNAARGESSSVSGGEWNGANYKWSSVSGGSYNQASGLSSSVSGGYDNTPSGDYSSVSGGQSNTPSGDYSSISGGYQNAASNAWSSVSGGTSNTASADYRAVVGDAGNVYVDSTQVH